jgi:hypothetical protein
MYKLLITRSEQNENYEAEKEKFNRESRYNMNAEFPKNYIEVKSLEV